MLIAIGDGSLSDDLGEIGVPIIDTEKIRRMVLSYHSVGSLRFHKTDLGHPETKYEEGNPLAQISCRVEGNRRLKAALFLQRNFRRQQENYSLCLRFIARKQFLVFEHLAERGAWASDRITTCARHQLKRRNLEDLMSRRRITMTERQFYSCHDTGDTK